MSAKRRKGPTPKGGVVRPTRPAATTPAARRLRPDEVPDTWQGVGRSTWALPGSAVLLIGAAATVPSTPVGAFPLLVAGLVLLLFGRVYVTCGPDGLRARSWPLPFINVHHELDDITSVVVEELRPRSWGGWGYRGSLKLGGRAAWLLRRGDGIGLGLPGVRPDRDGTLEDRHWAVTVDDAEIGAAVLAKHLAANES